MGSATWVLNFRNGGVMAGGSLGDHVGSRGGVDASLLRRAYMVSTAAFSHQPWESGIPFDLMEDKLHSFTATAMGFAFALGVLLRLVQRWRQDNKRQTLGIVTLLSATFLPVLILFQSDIVGLVQLLIFLVAYVWYGSEALELYGSATAQQDTTLDGDSATLHPRQ